MSEQEFLKFENHFKRLSERENINASEFELLTATAFALFTERKVDVGIIEVGMGGKLDATNILNNQVVSVISKIARDHQGFLGNTLEEIASHKAGILRPNVPYIVNPMNEFNVNKVIEEYAKEVGAGPRILVDSPELREDVFNTAFWRTFSEELLPFQQDNAILAFLAYLQVLKSLELSDNIGKSVRMLSKLKRKRPMPGRQQVLHVPIVFGSRRDVLIDGAHNPDAAETLKAYVDKKLRSKPMSGVHNKPNKDGKFPITWVLAMTEGKDPREVLRKLLRPGDNVITTEFGPVDGMPWVKPMDPNVLLSVALEVRPGITGLVVPKRGAYRALCAAKYISKSAHIVVAGSLYLIGDLLREHEVGKECVKKREDFPSIREIDQDERARVQAFLEKRPRNEGSRSPRTKEQSRPSSRADYDAIHLRELPPHTEDESEEARKLRIETAQLEQEMQSYHRRSSISYESEDSSSSSEQSAYSPYNRPASPLRINDTPKAPLVRGPTDNTKTGSGWDRIVDESARQAGEVSFRPGGTTLSEKAAKKANRTTDPEVLAKGEYSFRPGN